MKKVDKETSSEELIRFVNKLTQLEPVRFAGIAKMLKVSIKSDETTMRPYDEILSDIIDEFIQLNRIQRRNLLKIIKLAK